MKEYRRPQYKMLELRLREKRRFIEVISGPRQTGKTTLMRQLLENSKTPYTYITADIIEGNSGSWIAKHWEAARLNSKIQGTGHILAIDEIQKISGWSSIIKSFWDEDTFQKRNIKLMISGSSGLLLQQGLNESLAGRFEMTYLNHWSYAEMKSAFGWSPEQYIWFGGYPGSAELISNELRWKRYIRDSLIETTISRDILLMTRIDKPVLLRSLFDLGCSYSGQILSYNKMLGQLQDAGNTVTLAGYLDLLDRAGLIKGLEKYSGSIPRRKLSSPKLMVMNTALISSAMPLGFSEAMRDGEKWGRLVESAAGAHLINSFSNHDSTVWYWREANDEVDFIIQKGSSLLALEIKAGSRVNRRGLDKFCKLYPVSKPILIGTGGIPLDVFLSVDPAELF